MANQVAEARKCLIPNWLPTAESAWRATGRDIRAKPPEAIYYLNFLLERTESP